MSHAIATSFSLEAANRQPCYSGGPATLICKAVIHETDAAKTFVFEDVRNRSFDFKPGQYAILKLSIEGQTHTRAYSISSTPTRPHNLQITVKRVPGGLVSNFFCDQVSPGTRVEIVDITGEFNCIDRPADKPLFLSGGSGVTPVMSMLQYLTDTTAPVDVVFIHFAQTSNDVIFSDQLAFLAKRFRSVTLHVITTQDTSAVGSGATGSRLSDDVIKQLVPDYRERTLFVCGPEGFMVAARQVAEALTFRAVHEESFGAAIQSENTVGLGGDVYFSQSELTGKCGPDESLLQAALNTGVWIDSACQQGVCGNCKVKLIQGEVDMVALGGLSQAEMDAGYILTCCSRPKGAVSLEI